MNSVKMILGSSSSAKIQNTDLTEDLWLQIFLCLPLNAIFKFQCVSKVWLSLLSNPRFINKWIRLNSSYKSLPWILFQSYGTFSSQPKFLISYPQTLKSQIIPNLEHWVTFKFLNPYGKETYLLGSSHGLVLCTNNFYSPTEYYVCNPLTQKWISLPPPPTSTRVITGFECKSISSTTRYRVVRMHEFEEFTRKLNIEIFSSDLGEWKIYQVSCLVDVLWNTYNIHRSLVMVNDILYWIEAGCKMVVYNLNNDEADGQQCRLFNLPGLDQEFNSPNNSCYFLGESKGLLRYARILREQKTLFVCVFEEGWHLLLEGIDLRDLLAEMCNELKKGCPGEDSTFYNGKVLGFSPVDENVILLGYCSYVWGLNIQTRRYERLSEPSFLANTHLVPSNSHPSHPSYDSRIHYPFALKPMPTVLAPPSWIGTSVDASVSNLE